VAESQLNSEWGGDWTIKVYLNKATGTEQVVLVKGRIDPDQPTLVRMHAFSPFGDMFGEMSDRRGLLAGAMKMIGEAGSGVVVMINRPSPNMFSKMVKARVEGKAADPEVLMELRDYGVGAQVLADLGVHEMVLLTNNHLTLVALAGYGLHVHEQRPIPTN
jgi:3,4-dihydroxy 2-butanone 4-phosphate synthase/GTP cyclohydrolase II